MTYFYGTDLLDKLSLYYGNRLKTAVDQGLDDPQAKYHWLYVELDVRVKLLRQVELFLRALPEYLYKCTEDEAMAYLAGFTSPWYTKQNIGTLPETANGGGSPYFTASNPYWASISELMDVLDQETSFEVRPMFHVVMCEYVVRNVRLYFYLREKQFKPIDRDKFDELMMLDTPLPSTA